MLAAELFEERSAGGGQQRQPGQRVDGRQKLRRSQAPPQSTSSSTYLLRYTACAASTRLMCISVSRSCPVSSFPIAAAPGFLWRRCQYTKSRAGSRQPGTHRICLQPNSWLPRTAAMAWYSMLMRH